MITPTTIPGIPEFNWIPPVWEATKPDLTKDPLSQPEEPVFHDPTPLNGDSALNGRLGALKTEFPGLIDHVNGTRSLEPAPDSETCTELTMVPHPNSDFSHVDPGTYTDEAPDNEQARFLDAIHAVDALQGLAARDETMNESIQEALVPLRRAEGQLIIAPQRLSLVFENNLCKVTVLYGEMSSALEKPGQTGKVAYNNARAQYLELLEDLDDSEPTQFEPGKLGYGRAFKWSFVRPLIHAGKIKGAKIMAKWNPHTSSSGIPVPHG